MESEVDNDNSGNIEDFEINLKNFKSSVRWQTYLDELKKYSEKYFNSKKSDQLSLISYSPSLSKWVTQQRHLYKKNKLSEEKIKLLNEIEDWHWY